MNRIVRFAALACALFVAASCQNDERATSPAPSSTPVAFRFLGTAGSSTLPKPDVLAIRVWADDTDLLVDERYDWGKGEADLQVPLHRSLRFEVRGIRRRDSRDLLLWTASATDTLDDLSAEIPLVTMRTAPADTSAPNLLGAQTGGGAALVVLDAASGTMALSLPAGSSSGTISIPDSLADSLYVHGVADTAVDGFWTIRMGRSDTATIVLVGTNGAVATWKISATTRDLSPVALDIRLDNGATSGTRGDTLVFTLPYVVDSTPHLVLAPKVAADRPDSIALDRQELSKTASDWSVVVAVPRAGIGNGAFHRIVTEDSVGNRGEHLILIERSTDARAPKLAWATAPGPESLGVHDAKFVLRVIGGDSLRIPAFASKGLASASGAQLQKRAADTSWWSGSVSLLSSDSGAIVVTVSNAIESTWTLDTAWITRYDPRGDDRIRPTISVEALPEEGWTRATTTTVRGKASDERSDVLVLVKAANGTIDTANWNPSDSSWSFLLTWNSDGDTTISVHSVDASSNASIDEAIRIQRDTRPPAIAWKIPGDSSRIVRTGSEIATFFATDRGGALRSVALVDSTGDSILATRDGAVDSLWSAPVSLAGQQGPRSWIIRATDSAGNQNGIRLDIVRDTIAPRILRTAPLSSPDTVAGDSVEVSFDISDASPLASISIDGADMAANSHTATRTVAAPATGSSRRIIVRAEDVLGNTRIDSSLLLVSPVAAPIQTAGLPSGATGREFRASFDCPDSDAVLQDSSVGGWTTLPGTVFVGRDTSLILRCIANGTPSSTIPFSWTSKDTAISAPSWVAANQIPDSAITVAMTADSVLWLVSSHGLASYRFATDSVWHDTVSPITGKQSLDVAVGTTSDGSVWVYSMGATRTTVEVATLRGSRIRLDRSISTDTAIHVRPKMRVEASSFGLAYVSMGNCVLLIGPTNSTGGIKKFYDFAGPYTKRWASVADVAYEPSTGDFVVVGNAPETSWGANDGGIATVSQSYADVASSRLFSGGLASTRFPTAAATSPDGTLAIAVDSLGYGSQGSFSAGAEIRVGETKLPLPGAATAIRFDPTGKTMWLATTKSQTPILAYSVSGWQAISNLPTHTLDGTRATLAPTPWGSVWALMSADANGPKIHRYHAR